MTWLRGSALVLAVLATMLFGLHLWLGHQDRLGYDPQALAAAAADYDAEIVRDSWGIPHIFGERDADVAFGLAVAHAQDDISTIESTIPMYRGEAARQQGFDALPIDYLVQWLGAREAVIQDYSSALSPEVRAVIEGYVAGLNWYAASHPEDVDQRLYPITAVDIVTAFSVQHLFFYGFQRPLQELFKDARQRDIANGPQQVAGRLVPGNIPVGSNAMAVAASRSTDNHTRLLANSHQPLTGPLSWYEVQLQSNSGWVVHGGLFPGTPLVTKGITPHLGWGVTVNQPDLVDVFVLKLDPDDNQRYRLDGQWQPLQKTMASLKVKLLGNLYWTIEREIISSVHGPALRTDHGTYALRFAGHGEIRQADQWYRMNRARNHAEWRKAMDLGAIASFNFVYAGAEGHIALIHNSRSPIRAPGWNWQDYLPGDRSDLLWTETQSFADNPQVVDPTSGYVLSANQDPFQVTAPADNPDRSAYAPELGFPERMTNRAHRGLDLLAADPAISRAEFDAIKMDTSYSPRSRAVAYLQHAINADHNDDQLLQDAQKVLATWNLATTRDNRQARLGVCVLGVEWQAEQRRHAPPPAIEVLADCADELMARYNSLEVPWGEVNRLQHGPADLALDGGPDTLRAIYAVDGNSNGVLTAVGGDGLVMLAEWDQAGALHLRAVHQFGSATTRPESAHYADQAAMFAAGGFRHVTFDQDSIRASASSVLRVPFSGQTPAGHAGSDPG